MLFCHFIILFIFFLAACNAEANWNDSREDCSYNCEKVHFFTHDSVRLVILLSLFFHCCLIKHLNILWFIILDLRIIKCLGLFGYRFLSLLGCLDLRDNRWSSESRGGRNWCIKGVHVLHRGNWGSCFVSWLLPICKSRHFRREIRCHLECLNIFTHLQVVRKLWVQCLMSFSWQVLSSLFMSLCDHLWWEVRCNVCRHFPGLNILIHSQVFWELRIESLVSLSWQVLGSLIMSLSNHVWRNIRS